MALSATKLKRVFKVNDVELDDIPGLTLREVAKAYSGQYPQLLNSSFEFKEIDDKKNVEVYTVNTTVGLKG